MRAPFDDAALIEDEYFIGLNHRLQSMGDDKGAAISDEPRQGSHRCALRSLTAVVGNHADDVQQIE